MQQQYGGILKARGLDRNWQRVWAAQAEGLERYLRREGFDPLLTAAELGTLPLLLAGGASMYLAMLLRADGQEQASQQVAEEAAGLFQAQVALRPGVPVLQLQRVMCLMMAPPSQRAAAVAALREVFTQADASTGGRRC